MTADIRTAARAEAFQNHYSHKQIRDRYDADLLITGFQEGAVWAAARVTPTREQIVETLNSHDLDRRYCAPGTDWRCICKAEFGKLNGWKDHRADAILALLAELAEGES